MLSKPPVRRHVQGRRAVPHVPAHTVCVTQPPAPPPPQGGAWVRRCVPIQLPPGVIGDPFFCYDVWEPFGGG